MTDTATAERTAAYESATSLLSDAWGDTTALLSRVNSLRDGEESASRYKDRLRSDLAEVSQILGQIVNDLSVGAAKAKTRHDSARSASAIQEVAEETVAAARVLLDYADMRTSSAYVLYEHCSVQRPF